MDEPIRLRRPDEPAPGTCPWCTTPLDDVTGKCSACGRTAQEQPELVTEEVA